MPNIEDVVNYAILIAVAIGVILLFTGSFIELSVERQTSVQSRATINLLQHIVTEGPMLMTDSDGNRMKLVIDDTKFEGADLIDCCDSVQYGYRFSVAEVDGKTTNVKNELTLVSDRTARTNYKKGLGDFKEGDFCYTSLGFGTKFAADVPVNICDGTMSSCVNGVARIETVDSPLAQLSYWLSQICKIDFDASKRIPLSTDDYDVGDIWIEESESGPMVCLDDTCKRFYCEDTVTLLQDSSLLKEQFQRFPVVHTCSMSVILKNDTGMFLIQPGLPDDQPDGGPDRILRFLPIDKDGWTEGIEDTNHFSTTGSYKVVSDSGNEITDTLPWEGDFFISLIGEGGVGPQINNHPLYLDISNVPGEVDDCGGERCVKMIDGAGDTIFERINFASRISSPDEDADYILTWKLYDDNGACIVPTGGEKFRIHNKWTEYTIDLIKGPDYGGRYEVCDNSESTETFNWNIQKIEWNVCDGIIFDLFCDPLSPPKALSIDNFYFEGYVNE